MKKTGIYFITNALDHMEKFVEFMKNAPRNSDGTFARRRA